MDGANALSDCFLAAMLTCLEQGGMIRSPAPEHLRRSFISQCSVSSFFSLEQNLLYLSATWHSTVLYNRIALSRKTGTGQRSAQMTEPPSQGQAVAFIGLGAMGGRMASVLLKKGFNVTGFDVSEHAMARLRFEGGKTAGSPAEACSGASVLVVMVNTADQAEEVLFGSGTGKGHEALAGLDRDIGFVDAPVSGGTVGAASGTLTIMAAGSAASLVRADAVLKGLSQRLFVVGSAAGKGSWVKVVNQLLADSHIVLAAEAMALGAKAGLDTHLLYDVITHCAGNSWMFANRVPHMLTEDYTPHSHLYTALKDMRLVLGEAKMLGLPTPVAAAAQQQFLAAHAKGLGGIDDASVVQVYESSTGVKVSGSKGNAAAAVGLSRGTAA